MFSKRRSYFISKTASSFVIFYVYEILNKLSIKLLELIDPAIIVGVIISVCPAVAVITEEKVITGVAPAPTVPTSYKGSTPTADGISVQEDPVVSKVTVLLLLATVKTNCPEIK